MPASVTILRRCLRAVDGVHATGAAVPETSYHPGLAPRWTMLSRRSHRLPLGLAKLALSSVSTSPSGDPLAGVDDAASRFSG